MFPFQEQEMKGMKRERADETADETERDLQSTFKKKSSEDEIP